MALNPGRDGGGSGGAGGNVGAPGSPGSGFKPNSAQAAPIDSEMPRRQRRLLEVEGRTNLSIDYNDHTFKMTFDVTGFRKENIKAQRDGRSVTIDCHQLERHHIGPSTSAPLPEHGHCVFIADELVDRVQRQTALLPEHTDLNTVMVEVDAKNGVVVVTGKVLPAPLPAAAASTNTKQPSAAAPARPATALADSAARKK